MSPDRSSWVAPSLDELRALGARPLQELALAAAALRDLGHGDLITYSPKVFIPLTRLCRDVCSYCTFARKPKELDAPYLTLDEVLAIARAGAAAGCKEALFTLGDRPETRYSVARAALDRLGYASTIEYLAAAAAHVLDNTGLLPHINAGVLDAGEYERLRSVAPSMGLMLESSSVRLAQRGGPHFGSPDKRPAVRLATLRLAGEARIPMTTGLLVGIGETRDELLQSLLAIRELHEVGGHIQEVIIQNFAPKVGTRMSAAPAPPFDDVVWAIAMARLALGPDMSIQAPPNLNDGRLASLVAAGIDDWGGVSPVTVDHVNPEAPWPQLERLAHETRRAGKTLVPRLTIRAPFARDPEKWVAPALRGRVRMLADGAGQAREDGWMPGARAPVPTRSRADGRAGAAVRRLLDVVAEGRDLEPGQIAALLASRGDDCEAVLVAADELRRRVCGDRVSYVVTRNINYTNVCSYKCSFCAFSKGRVRQELRGAPYLVSLEEISRRTAEAWERGATEVCMQGGIHPSFDGSTYLAICEAAKRGAPGIHVHAFSPLEVTHGATTLGLSVAAFLQMLRERGLASLPGTAAEILDDGVRARICPDKIDTAQWLHVIEAAHGIGLRTTATMMFGHVDTYAHWARHLVLLRDLQRRTGGITEFVPLPFVPMEAPLYRRGGARSGPTWREVLLVHAVARLALHPYITNVQVSWPKVGPDGALACLAAGANDLGGTLMNESISRAAGAGHGQEFAPGAMEALIAKAGRHALQRTTCYDAAPSERYVRSHSAAALDAVRTVPPQTRRAARRAPAESACPTRTIA